MKTIGIIIVPMLLFIWLIINTIYLLKKLKKAQREANKDLNFIVTCEKCKNEHNATIDDILSTKMRKTITITPSVNIGPIGASTKYYKYFAKKIYCPTCNKKTWSEIKNYNDVTIQNIKSTFPIILEYFASLLIGGLIIIFIAELFI